MAIRFKCPHGHTLKVDDALAGKAGRCPRCQAMVQIPAPKAEEFSEDSIIDILGQPERMPSHPSDRQGQGNHRGDGRAGRKEHRADAGHGSKGRDDDARHEAPMKSCVKCNERIPAACHICPHCHTYIANVAGR